MNAYMSDFDLHRKSDPLPPQWEGFAEIDRAIRENCLMEYRVRKSWADPWSRRLGIAVLALFALFVCFVVYWDVLRG